MPEPGERKRNSVRARAWIPGLVAILPVVYACTNQSVSNIFSLLAAPIAALLIVLILNLPFRKFAPKWGLNTVDLIIFYVIVSVGGAVASEWLLVSHSAIHGFPLVAKFNPTVKDQILPNMPEWLSFHDAAPLKEMEEGGKGIAFVWSKLPLFLPKYLGWGLIFMLFMGAMVAVNSLMRHAWCRTEKLAFPLIQLPVAMCEAGPGSMWRSRFVWGAFAVMFAVDMLNGLNYLYPAIPSIPVKELVNLETLFKEPPWSNIGYLPISFYPFLAAIGLLIPSDLLFSIVFFFLFRKAMNVIMAANGVPQGWYTGTAISPGPPYWDEQTWGAVLAIFFVTVWVSRRYLRGVWDEIKKGSRSEDGGIPHRWAFVTLIACFSGLVAISSTFSMPIWYSVLLMALVLIFGFVLTRLRAQLGPPTHEFAFFGPNSFLFRLFGTEMLSEKQAVFLGQVMVTVNRIHRTHPMPYQLEAMKMTDDRRVHQGKVAALILGSTALAFLAGYFFLHVYAYRMVQPYRWNEGEPFVRNILSQKHGFDPIGTGMTALGAGVVLALDAIRFRIPGFPLHPGGYVLSMNFGVDYYWFGLLIALLVKSFVTRYHGLPGYEKLRQVAFGILLAEYAAEAIWMIFALSTGHSTYTISFNERGLGSQ